jgi:hypothetical protein
MAKEKAAAVKALDEHKDKRDFIVNAPIQFCG